MTRRTTTAESQAEPAQTQPSNPTLAGHPALRRALLAMVPSIEPLDWEQLRRPARPQRDRAA